MLQNKFKTDELFDLLPPKMEEYFYRKLVGESQQEIRIKLIEFLKFCLLYPQTKCNIPFNDEIDEIWHLWILQTRQYQDLMDKLPAKTFIHHTSNEYTADEEMSDPKKEVNMQVSFLVSYVYNFGDFTEETVHFWPMANKLYYKHDNNMYKLNQFLRELATNYA